MGKGPGSMGSGVGRASNFSPRGGVISSMDNLANLTWVEWCAAVGLGVALLAVASVVAVGFLVWLAGLREHARH